MKIDRPDFGMQMNTTPAVQPLPQAGTGEVPQFTVPGMENQQKFSVPLPEKNMTPQEHMKNVELMKRCQEFESVLISQMFKQMRPKGEDEDLFGKTKDREMFNAMLDDERAKVWAQQGGIGLASTMFQQMKDA